MRKVKFYFGKRRLRHTWGIDLEGSGKLWVVPRILRGYFARESQAFLDRCGLQMIDIEANVLGREPSVAVWRANRDGSNPVLQEILKYPAERSAAPEKVGTIRYCDYELEHSPETQAAYDEAVAKIIKD